MTTQITLHTFYYYIIGGHLNLALLRLKKRRNTLGSNKEETKESTVLTGTIHKFRDICLVHYKLSFTVLVDEVTKMLHNSLFTFLLSKARQAKTEHMEMKISQPIFGILVALTKNEVTKICNEPGINHMFIE